MTKARPYDLDLMKGYGLMVCLAYAPPEIRRLHREVLGYLKVSRFDGTDHEGREYAIKALEEIVRGDEAQAKCPHGHRYPRGPLDPGCICTCPTCRPDEVEIIGPDGKVHYRRPEGDPLLDEARQTQGYSVRPAPDSKGARLHPPDSTHDECGVCGGCEEFDDQCGVRRCSCPPIQEFPAPGGKDGGKERETGNGGPDRVVSSGCGHCEKFDGHEDWCLVKELEGVKARADKAEAEVVRLTSELEEAREEAIRIREAGEAVEKMWAQANERADKAEAEIARLMKAMVATLAEARRQAEAGMDNYGLQQVEKILRSALKGAQR